MARLFSNKGTNEYSNVACERNERRQTCCRMRGSLHRRVGYFRLWDSSIRILHAFEALPYGLAAVLCLRQRKLGYLLGAASGAFWLWGWQGR
jgi:hypothetical protein